MTQVFQCPTKIYICEDGLKEAAEKYGMSVEDFEKEIGSKELFKYDLLMRKAMEIVTK